MSIELSYEAKNSIVELGIESIGKVWSVCHTWDGDDCAYPGNYQLIFNKYEDAKELYDSLRDKLLKYYEEHKDADCLSMDNFTSQNPKDFDEIEIWNDDDWYEFHESVSISVVGLYKKVSNNAETNNQVADTGTESNEQKPNET